MANSVLCCPCLALFSALVLSGVLTQRKGCTHDTGGNVRGKKVGQLFKGVRMPPGRGNHDANPRHGVFTHAGFKCSQARESRMPGAFRVQYAIEVKEEVHCTNFVAASVTVQHAQRQVNLHAASTLQWSIDRVPKWSWRYPPRYPPSHCHHYVGFNPPLQALHDQLRHASTVFCLTAATLPYQPNATLARYAGRAIPRKYCIPAPCKVQNFALGVANAERLHRYRVTCRHRSRSNWWILLTSHWQY